MNCTKAIIPIAGYGTRRLPITKTIEKAMLPILNRPVIDYVVEDCVKAGITDIYFVISEGSTQIRDYYSRNEALEAYLETHKKHARIKQIIPPKHVTFHYVEQPSGEGTKYGTAVPVWLCREFIEPNENFLVLMGDDFIFNPDGSSELKRLMKGAGNHAAMLGVEVSETEVVNYGVIAAEDYGDIMKFNHIQEKPTMEEAESNLINISKYAFPAAFLQYLDAAMQEDKKTGEYYITDPLNTYVNDGNEVRVIRAQGEYLDSGTVENWLYANQYIAGHLASV